ncbi:site-specific DNA-methyltransferase [Campylobacter lari]|nr:site-specific DNA-methyltransferase [Campylobacter lari]
MERNELQSLQELKEEEKIKILDRASNGILENENADFLIKLIDNAENKTEVLKISALGMTYKRTGFHFDVRLEKNEGQTIRYLKKNENLSFDQGGITHKLIIGDNYPALLNLLINYKNKIKVIYIDPPYGKDHLGAFAQTNYNNAITRDNLLSMLYPRLILARQLLKDDGVIFCSIDDRNQAYVKCLFDEVFGEGNFLYMLSVVNNLNGNDNSSGMIETQEHCLFYAKNKDYFEVGVLPLDDEDSSDWQIDDLGYWKLGGSLKATGIDAPREARPNLFFPIWINKQTLEISLEEQNNNWHKLIPLTDGKEVRWCWSKDKFIKDKDEVIVKKVGESYSLYKKQRPQLGDLPSKRAKTTFYSPKYANANSNKELKEIFKEKKFDYPKASFFIKDLISIANTNQNDIILDFFAGSGTTGHAVLELNKQDGGNRQFILVTNNEITDLNPNGIALDVTSKRLKRIMSGECYDESKDFKWLEKNTPYGDSLEVSEIENIASSDHSVFEKIDEKLYGKDFENIHDKIEWICKEFELTCRKIEGE